MSYGQVLQFAYENLVKWFKKCKYLLYPVFWNWLVFISECPLFMKFQRRKSTGPQLYVFSDALFPRLVWNWSHNACSVTWKFQTLDNIFNRNNSDDCCSQLKGQKNPTDWFQNQGELWTEILFQDHLILSYATFKR